MLIPSGSLPTSSSRDPIEPPACPVLLSTASLRCAKLRQPEFQGDDEAAAGRHVGSLDELGKVVVQEDPGDEFLPGGDAGLLEEALEWSWTVTARARASWRSRHSTALGQQCRDFALAWGDPVSFQP